MSPSTGNGRRLLVFAEDPGAANAAAPLIGPLRSQGWWVDVRVNGLAEGILRRRGIDARVVPAKASDGQLLEEARPHAVLVGTAENRRTRGLGLIDAARVGGVPSVALVDARMNARHRFRGEGSSPLGHVPDWLLVPDAWTGERYVSLGFSADRVVVCGRPHEDYILMRRVELEKEGRTEVRERVYPSGLAGQIVLFVSEGAAPDTDRRGEGGSFDSGEGRMESVLDVLLEVARRLKPPPHVLLRPHPKDGPGDFTAFSNRLDGVATSGDPLELAFAADLVVGCTSSLLGEAALLGTKALALLPRAEDADLLPLALGVDSIPRMAFGDLEPETLAGILTGEGAEQLAKDPKGPSASDVAVGLLDKIVEAPASRAGPVPGSRVTYL